MRVTDLQANKVISQPRDVPEQEELKIQNRKVASLQATRRYVAEECEDNLLPTGGHNLTRQEAMGRKEIVNGIKSRGWMLYETDKSDKMVLDTVENFVEAMRPHYQNHRISSLEEVAESERLMSNHSK